MRQFLMRVVACFMLAFGLGACGGGQGSDASSGTIRNFTVGQNGTFSSPWGDGTASQRPAMAVKITPPSYPVTLTSVTIYPNNNTGSDQGFTVRGFSDLTTETDLFPPVQNLTIPDTGTTYAAKTITIPPTTISSGSVYLVVEWVTKPLASASGTNTFSLRTDNQLDVSNASFIRFSGTTWSSLESVSASSGDLGIIANYGQVAVNDKPVMAAVDPANGATGVSRSLQELKIQFNKEMGPGVSVSSNADWPLSGPTPRVWSADHRTFFISRDNAASLLPAGTQLQFTFNPSGHTGAFMDIFGNSLDSTTVSFTTGQ